MGHQRRREAVATVIVAAVAASCCATETRHRAQHLSPSVPRAEPEANDWRHHPSPIPDTLHNGFFVDHNLGWILAHASGRILSTTDGGLHWRILSQIDPGFYETIVFLDRKRGWICGDRGRIWASSDSGRTWQRVGQFPDEIAFYTLHFFSEGRGIVAGFDKSSRAARLFETEDGGISWRERSSETPGFAITDAIAARGSELWLGGRGRLYVTKDHGRRWQTTSLDSQAMIRGLHRLGDRLWAVGSGGLAAVSNDGGATWTSVPTFGKTLLRSVVFLNHRVGYVAGDRDSDGNALWRTEDAGETWVPEHSQTPSLHRLFVGAGRLWAVGESGIILSQGADFGGSPHRTNR